MSRRGFLAAMVADAAAAISPPVAASRAAPSGELRGKRYRKVASSKGKIRVVAPVLRRGIDVRGLIGQRAAPPRRSW
jgi:hypothetical protein